MRTTTEQPRANRGFAALILLCAACGGAQRAPIRDLFDVRVPYVASLGYWMLNGVHPRSHPDLGEGFREAFRRAQAAELHRAKGTENPWYRCAASSGSADHLATCFGRLTLSADRPRVRRAVAEYDRWLTELWPGMSVQLAPLAVVLDRKLNEDYYANDLADLILRVGNVSRREVRVFPIIVVQRRPRSGLLGQHVGSFAFVYSTGGDSTTERMGTVLHEFAHHAFNASDVSAMERRFALHGVDGAIAGNHWNEALATYFGVVAKRHYRVTFDTGRPWYGVRAIDRIARELYELWGERPRRALGPDLADDLVRIVRQRYPRDQRTFSDLLRRRVLVSESSEVRAALYRSMNLNTWQRSVTPMPNELPRFDDQPPTASTLIMATYDEARSHPGLMASVDTLPRGTDTRRLAAFLGEQRGAPLLVVLAPDHRTLVSVAERLPRVRLPVRLGWFERGTRMVDGG